MSKKVHFKVSARTARLIGRENVSSAESALIELVKNAYDADAQNCIIYFDNKGQLHIMDDGHGMSDTIIEDYWMTIGTNNKERDYISSKLGRIKSGEKGIGRFALDRLGQTCSMLTKPIKSEVGFIWVADWKDFESDEFDTVEQIEADLDTVKLQLSNTANEIFSATKTPAIKSIKQFPFNSGTFISVEDLRDSWQSNELERLYKSLSTLIPPKEQTTFDIYLFSEQYPKRFGKIETSPCDDYDYKVIAEVSQDNKALITITRNEFDLKRIDPDLFKRGGMKEFPFDMQTFSNKTFKYEKTLSQLMPGFEREAAESAVENIGGFTFTFYFMKKHLGSEEKEKFFHKDINAKLRNDWLQEHVGIKIFRDNFRVRPYGEPNSSSMDWLGLGPRYGSNPAGVARKGQYKTREHNLSGIVDISRVNNPFLKDLSSRTGIHENSAFDLFKQLLISIVNEFEYDRSYIAYEMDALHKAKSPKEERAKRAEEIAKRTKKNQKRTETEEEDTTEDIEVLIQHAEDLKEERDELLNEQKILRVLASSGSMLATFGHEVHAMQNIINDRAATLKSLIEPYLDEATAIDIPSAFNPYSYIDQTAETDEKLLHWMKFALSGIRKDKRNRRKIGLKKYFSDFESLWKLFLEDRKIEIKINPVEDDVKFRGFEAELDALFNNLIINSVEVFSKKIKFDERRISFSVARKDQEIHISYRDTGTGLSPDIDDPSKIFNLYFSTKRNPNTGQTIGTGIGMYLVKSIVDDYEGSMSFGKAQNGFSLNITLPAA
ncbi:sensor histidine kinase [Kordiimonas pumila]|uniref:histidine kinase n=1 Tax=Kordiimonas pumila TaxID=2161677 RepID=A0ABV7D558_9PROT|nr:sensor histidine kinase [Kordiimonas pumila]